ncbi:MAG: hypothetical protein GC154_21905 [bacterium]|nr:hypothetical protein [bacterium]
MDMPPLRGQRERRAQMDTPIDASVSEETGAFCVQAANHAGAQFVKRYSLEPAPIQVQPTP